MALVLTEEQRLLKDTAKRFCTTKTPITQLRQLRDEKSADGFDKASWKEMAEQGWAGIIIPEKFGGLDFGYKGLGAILEETGRTLTASPLMSTVVLCSTAITLGGSDSQKQEILPAVASGERLLSLALEEGSRHAPYHIATSATAKDGGYLLNGNKTFVLDGHVADQLIVVARTSGDADDESGLTLFLVDPAASGVKRTRTMMVDSRNAANIAFKNVQVGSDAVIGQVDKGSEVLEKVLDRGRICLAAEMLGSIREAFERTVAYLKERQQFGVLIGTFQGLKHRAAEMFCEIELCKSAVIAALAAIDEDSPEVPVLASLAKSKVSDTFQLVSNEGVQMHGGIGMTDEHEIGFFMKRARVAQHTLGDANFHRDRFATLSQF